MRSSVNKVLREMVAKIEKLAATDEMQRKRNEFNRKRELTAEAQRKRTVSKEEERVHTAVNKVLREMVAKVEKLVATGEVQRKRAETRGR